MGKSETTDVLSRTLRIIQYRQGHRAASDDLFLAWAAIRAKPDARRILDLGSGKGTVALLILRALPEANVVGVEAHSEHHALAVRNAEINALSDRYSPRLGDLRDPTVLDQEQPFDVVCGAPPFLPIGTGVLPKDAGRAAGRFELRGGIEEYINTAVRHLAESGRAVFLMNGPGLVRAEKALRSCMQVCRVVAVRPKPGNDATYWVFEAGLEPTGGTIEEEVCMRHATGNGWSTAYREIRRILDLPEQD